MAVAHRFTRFQPAAIEQAMGPLSGYNANYAPGAWPARAAVVTE